MQFWQPDGPRTGLVSQLNHYRTSGKGLSKRPRRVVPAAKRQHAAAGLLEKLRRQRTWASASEAGLRLPGVLLHHCLSRPAGTAETPSTLS